MNYIDGSSSKDRKPFTKEQAIDLYSQLKLTETHYIYKSDFLTLNNWNVFQQADYRSDGRNGNQLSPWHYIEYSNLTLSYSVMGICTSSGHNDVND